MANIEADFSLFDGIKTSLFTERELIMASAAASCKSEKAHFISSPLNGGLMEQVSLVVVHVKIGNNQHQLSSKTESVIRTTCTLVIEHD